MSEHGDGGRPDLPTAKELMEKKQRELAKWIEDNGKFLPSLVADQLNKMLEQLKFIPKNVMNFLEKGFEALEDVDYPAEVFQLDSTQLPQHKTEIKFKTYSPVCSMAAILPGANLFPLRVLQRTQTFTARKQIGAMDPINRRALGRQGLLQVNTELGNAKDAKKFNGFPFATDIVEITEIMARVSDSPIKRAIFSRIATARLTGMADRLDKTVKKFNADRELTEKETPVSRLGMGLRELALPENIDFVLDQVGATVKSWAEGRTETAEVAPIKNGEHILELAQHDPFWFVNISDTEVIQRCQDLEKELRTFIQNYLAGIPRGSITNFRQELLGSAMGHDFLESYINKPIEDIFNEELQTVIKTTLDQVKQETTKFLSGQHSDSESVKLLENIFDQAIIIRVEQEQKKEKREKISGTSKRKITDMDDDEMEAEAAVALSEEQWDEIKEKFNQKIAELESDSERQTPAYHIARIIELNRSLTHRLTEEELKPLFLLFNRLGSRYAKELFKPENRTKIDMSDLNSFTSRSSPSKFKKLYQLLTQLSDEKLAEQNMIHLIAESLDKLSDTDFINLYTQWHTDSRGGPFNNMVLSETYTPHGYKGKTYPNRYLAARERLLRLYQDNPSLFKDSPKLVQTIDAYLKKKK
jgi:hypothetical protein